MDDNSRLSVVVPVFNASSTLKPCLEAVKTSRCAALELIAVDDCSTDNSVGTAREFASKVIELDGGPYGPAYARNRGVEQASGDVILFVDCDVIVHEDTIEKVNQTFSDYPAVDATFGSYDDSPSEGEYLSQFKNLIHHFVHQQAQESGGTFWAGCGAIRKSTFLEVGGFDEDRYTKPSIEDIELGYRLRTKGSQIFVNKAIQVKHLKRWTLSNWIKTDIFSRAVPWTELILQSRSLPDDLNLESGQRFSAALSIVFLLSLFVAWDFNLVILFTLFWLLALMVLNKCNQQEGKRFFQFSRNEAATITLLFIVLTGGAYYLAEYTFLYPAGWVLAGVLAGVFIPSCGTKYKRILFAFIVSGFAIGFGCLVFDSSIWLGLFSTILLSAILIWNRQLLAFFYRKRGLFFAAAAVPFQLTYYLYSTAAFITSGMVYFWKARLKGQ